MSVRFFTALATVIVGSSSSIQLAIYPASAIDYAHRHFRVSSHRLFCS